MDFSFGSPPAWLRDRLPPGGRAFLEAGGWWLVLAILALLALLLAAWFGRGLFRLLGGGRRRVRPGDDRDLSEDLSDCPLSAAPPEVRVLTVYHLAVRMRLVVVAPIGRDADLDATAVEKLLDQVIPRLGDITRWDRPRVRVWPPQLSAQGFTTAFHRNMHKPEAEGEPSRWVLVAGRAQIGRQGVLVGLGLWAERPNTIGRLTLDPHQWLDVLRLQRVEDV
jgi:hypothetical protein